MGMSFKVVNINHSYLPSRANTSVHLQLWNPTTADQSPVLQFWTGHECPPQEILMKQIYANRAYLNTLWWLHTNTNFYSHSRVYSCQ